MTTVYVDRDSISLKTRSRSGCSPQHFIILKKELQRLEEKKYLITKDRAFVTVKLGYCFSTTFGYGYFLMKMYCHKQRDYYGNYICNGLGI